MPHPKILLPLLINLLLPLAAEAAIYVWVDSAGNENIADNLSKVPEQYRDKARKLGEPEATINTAVPAQPVRTKTTGTLPAQAVHTGTTGTFAPSKVPMHQQDLVSRAAGTVKPRTPVKSTLEETDAKERDENGHDEQWWRKQVRNLRAKISAEEEFLANQKPSRGCSQKPNMRRREQSEEKLKALKQQLEDLPEQARKAGAQPGWLRE